jgi:hypothetical protein
MTFIERLFGLAPDNGSGALELLLFAVPIAIALLISAVRLSRRGRHRTTTV